MTTIASNYSVQPTNYTGYNPYYPGGNSGGGYTPQVGAQDTFGNDSFSSIGSMVAHAGGGGFAAYKHGAQMGANIKGMFGNGFKGVLGGVKDVAITGLKGAGVSALVSAGVSAVANGVGMATGSVDSSQAMSNVIGDTIGGAVGGLGAVTVGGLGNMALSSFGMGGTLLTVGTVALGAVGGVLGGQLTKGLTEGF